MFSCYSPLVGLALMLIPNSFLLWPSDLLCPHSPIPGPLLSICWFLVSHVSHLLIQDITHALFLQEEEDLPMGLATTAWLQSLAPSTPLESPGPLSENKAALAAAVKEENMPSGAAGNYSLELYSNQYCSNETIVAVVTMYMTSCVS